MKHPQSISDIAKLIEADAWRMQVLRGVDSLNLPDYAIGAGFVRAAVWDVLTDRPKPTPLSDIDVLYFDPENCQECDEKQIEAQLKAQQPELPWSVKNQARMHLRNGDAPYRDTNEAIAHWLETPTCIAARLGPSGHVELLAPYGIDDLLTLRIRPTNSGRQKLDQYKERVTTKNWPTLWPGVVVEGLD